MQCDSLLNDACDNLGIFELIEEIINSVFGMNIPVSSLSCAETQTSIYNKIRGTKSRPDARCRASGLYGVTRRPRIRSI